MYDFILFFSDLFPVKETKSRGGWRQIEDTSMEKYKVFKCDTCDKTFSSNYRLNGHISTQHDHQYCQICGKHFSSKQRYRRHSDTAHQKFNCESCNKIFSTKQRLEYHILHTHLKQKNEKTTYKCKICEKILNHKDAFLKHKAICKYECKRCNQIFSSKQWLDYHILHSHEMKIYGKPTFKCEICKTSFARRQKLDYHIIARHGVKKNKPSFKCKICKKKFKHASGLQWHKTRLSADEVIIKNEALRAKKKQKGNTTGRNYYTCIMCLRMFSSQQNVLIHQEKHNCE